LVHFGRVSFVAYDRTRPRVQHTCDWLPVLRPGPGPRHAFLPPPPASEEIFVDSVFWSQAREMQGRAMLLFSV